MKLTLKNAEKRLSSTRWSTRKKGMEMLVELGERNLILKYALSEKTPAVLDVAANALYPEPTELLIHITTVVKGPDANLAMRYHVPFGNFLYASEELAEAYRRRKNRLHYDVIEAAGLAELRSFANYLGKYLTAPLETVKSARDRGDKNAVAGVRVSVDSDGSDTWSRPAQCAIESAVALRRMGHEIDRVHLERMHYELPEAMCSCNEQRRTKADLQWALFDLGDDRQYSSLVELALNDFVSIGPDLLTTLIRRGERKEVKTLAHKLPSYDTHRGEFHFWPLCDVMQSLGLLELDSLQIDHYAKARDHGISPPNWWSWLDTER